MKARVAEKFTSLTGEQPELGAVLEIVKIECSFLTVKLPSGATDRIHRSRFTMIADEEGGKKL